MIGYTLAGAVLLYARWARDGAVHTIGIGAMLERLGARGLFLTWAEFILFVSLGTLIGHEVTQPVNATQALAAGVGWTALFARGPGEPEQESLQAGQGSDLIAGE